MNDFSSEAGEEKLDSLPETRLIKIFMRRAGGRKWGLLLSFSRNMGYL